MSHWPQHGTTGRTRKSVKIVVFASGEVLPKGKGETANNLKRRTRNDEVDATGSCTSKLIRKRKSSQVRIILAVKQDFFSTSDLTGEEKQRFSDALEFKKMRDWMEIRKKVCSPEVQYTT